jgi:hypothetical protein
MTASAVRLMTSPTAVRTIPFAIRQDPVTEGIDVRTAVNTLPSIRR